MIESRPSVRHDVRWAQTVTATAVVHTSFESLILLVSENVSFFNKGIDRSPLTPLNFGVIGGGVKKSPFFQRFRKFAAIIF